MTPALASINPATGRLVRNHRPHSALWVEAALKRARGAAKIWRETRFSARSRLLRRAAVELRRRSAEFAALISLEMGKPLAESRSEVEKCAGACEFFAREGPAMLASERPRGAAPSVRVSYEPLGVVLAIMPWNFPFWQAFRAAAPALMAGNVILLKHSPNVCGCALALESIFQAAAEGDGALFQTLLIPASGVPPIIADPRVQGVTLTGSVRAGRAVAALAGAAMKKAVFELGGSDAYLILEDADLDQAAETCAQSRLINGGQSCIAAKRFVVVERVRRDFERKFAARLSSRRVGDPSDPATDIGPMARRDLRDHLHAQVLASIRAGAKLQFGGRPLPGPGYYYPPTLLTQVRKGQPAYDEELFGPVAAVISAQSEEAAIAIANDSVYGLGAAVFSRRRRRAEAVAARLEAGTVVINDFVRSDPAVPFGGIKLSGHGRELGSAGIREFTNIKAIRI